MTHVVDVATTPSSVLTFGSLFAGIGGFDLGFERAGMQCRWQVELNQFASRILQKHWPHVPRWRDVRTFPRDAFDAGVSAEELKVDVICGGFPCQDISTAGKRLGIEGERSGLWTEFARIIRAVRPRFVVIENVAALAVRGIDRVLGDLADSGYDAEWDLLRASQFGVRHKRARIFIVAYSDGDRPQGWRVLPQAEHVPTLDQVRNWPDISEPLGLRSRHGFPSYVDRITVIGNAVVPQVAEWIGRQIIAADAMRRDDHAA